MYIMNGHVVDTMQDPIMINRKKTWDVQFFAVVVEAVINMEGIYY